MQSTSIKKIYSNIDSIISGEKTRKSIKENIGNTLKDLVFYMPYKIVSAFYCKAWNDLENKKKVLIKVRVNKHYFSFPRSNIPYRISVIFDNKTINLVFFSKYTGYLKSIYKEGEDITISGTLATYGKKFQILHPTVVDLNTINPETNTINTLFYRQKGGLKSSIIHKSILKTLPLIPEIEEWHSRFKERYPLMPSWKEALNNIHLGNDNNILEDSSIHLLRLAYDEILANQLSLEIIRNSINKEKSNNYNKDSKNIISKFINCLEFNLTIDQRKNVEEIIKDLNFDNKMLRLLHGDVGSGKTIVALISALHVINSGYQVAFLAPTEILAIQHYNFVKKKFKQLNINVFLLTASIDNKKQIINKIKSDEKNLVIGTHALLQKNIIFKNLSYVIIDEQHRFGVNQRISIRNKGKKVDMLLMSATPIPRTMLLANLGDISVSTVKQKPFNTKINTILKSDRNIKKVISFIKEKIKYGKVFWICPYIDSSTQENNSSSIEERYKILKSSFDEVGYLHGKLPIEEKNQVLKQFKDGKIKLLISTVVIEVGIDIPDANIIIIDHADRFGLAQTHQLRGRVGRGEKNGTCILLYKEPLSETAKERLIVIKNSYDGFELSEKDLIMRGGGEILGKNQYGYEDFIFFDISIHQDLLKMATLEATDILNNDPNLASDRGKKLIDLLYLFEKNKAIDFISAG